MFSGKKVLWTKKRALKSAAIKGYLEDIFLKFWNSRELGFDNKKVYFISEWNCVFIIIIILLWAG